MKGLSSQHLASAVCVLLLLCSITEAKRDYYDVLEIPKSASDRQIKKAFHKLAMKYHPDKNSSPDAEMIFREIAEAYEVLSSGEKRRQYDELGHEAFETESEDSGTFGANFFHFSFEEFFQGLQFDDDMFFDSSGDTWSFQMGDDDEEDVHLGETFFNSDLFNFFGDRFNEMSSDHTEDGFKDQESDFCWIQMQSDGSIVRVCEED